MIEDYIQIDLFEDQDSLFGKTCKELSPAQTEKTSDAYLKKSAKSQTQSTMFLNLKGGKTAELSWEKVSPSHGDLWMHNFTVSPSAVKESALSQILEEKPHTRFYLSKKACEGILRRAKERGKVLPEMLKEALENQSR